MAVDTVAEDVIGVELADRESALGNGDPQTQAWTRAAFLTRLGALSAGGAMALARCFGGTTGRSVRPQPAGPGGGDPRLRDASLKARRWDIVTIGNLSRNRYWGESDDRGLRPAVCTCTLITGGAFRLLVDPSWAEASAMARELDRRTGLKPGDIQGVFVTHDHGDHVAGLAHFPEARWLAAPGVAGILNAAGVLPRRIEGVTGRLYDTVDILPLPGHTKTHHGLRFECDGLSVVIAGDAVATRDFFLERRSFFNAADFDEARRTMEAMAAMADIIVPGHDNYFVNRRPGRRLDLGFLKRPSP